MIYQGGKNCKIPLPDREASRLLIYDRGVVSETFFSQVPALLKSGQTLIFNKYKGNICPLIFSERKRERRSKFFVWSLWYLRIMPGISRVTITVSGVVWSVI